MVTLRAFLSGVVAVAVRCFGAGQTAVLIRPAAPRRSAPGKDQPPREGDTAIVKIEINFHS